MLPFNSWSLSYYSCDRLLAIRKPWWYRNHVTRSHAIKQMSFVWAMIVIISGIEVASLYFTTAKLIFRLLAVGWYSLCVLGIISCHVVVLIANARHRAGMGQYGGHMRTALASEKEVANSVCLILIVLCLTTLPSLIVPFALLQVGFLSDHLSPFRPLVF